MRIRAYQLAKWLTPRIPLAVSYRVADLAGDLIWYFARSVRQNFEHNQRRALAPTATANEVARSSRYALRHLAKLYVDEFRIPALSKEEIRRSITIHGLQHLEEAYAKEQGVILVSAHYGAISMVGQMLAVLDYPAMIAVEHVQPESVFQFMCELRTSHGLRLIPIDKPLMGLVRTLRKQNGVVALAVDRNISQTGIRMPFLGEETLVPCGAAQLAILTGSPIIVSYCRRLPNYGYEAFVKEPFYVNKNSYPTVDQAIYEGTARLMADVEGFIREQPSQWVMSVPLWKDQKAQDEDSSSYISPTTVNGQY